MAALRAALLRGFEIDAEDWGRVFQLNHWNDSDYEARKWAESVRRWCAEILVASRPDEHATISAAARELQALRPLWAHRQYPYQGLLIEFLRTQGAETDAHAPVRTGAWTKFQRIADGGGAVRDDHETAGPDWVVCLSSRQS